MPRTEVKPAAHAFILCRRLWVTLEELRDSAPSDESALTRAKDVLFDFFERSGPPDSWRWAIWPGEQANDLVWALYDEWCALDLPRPGAA